ncbi:MAG: cytochrome P450 [Kribbellaceae bacterium]
MSAFPIGAAVTLEELELDPHSALARLRAEEPVSWLPALNGWLVTRRDLAVQVMRDTTTYTVDDPRFSTAQVVGPSMLSLDGEAHTRHRQPFEYPFGLARTRERFTAYVEAEAARLVDTIAPAGKAELRRSVAGPLSVAVMAEALGLPDVDAGTVLTWYDAIVASVSGVASGRAVTVEGTTAFGRLREHVAAAVQTADPDRSMVAAAGRDGLAVDEVVSNAAVLLFGGIETTEGMICNAVWHLLSHPDQLDLVRASPDLLANAVEESLRLEPAAAVVDRYATHDADLAGTTIPRGDLVTVSLAGAGRDPDVFADPDVFDVRRANARRHLAFAGGPHICVGMHLARLEAVTTLRTLFSCFPDLHLDPTRPASPTGLVFRKPQSLPVRW